MPAITVILFIISAINLLALFFIKSGKKYWLFSIPLWAILFTSFLLFRNVSNTNINRQEKTYRDNTGDKSYGSYDQWTKLENSKVKARKTNSTILSSLGFQTILTFFLQLKGKRDTSLNIYKWTVPVFAVLSAIVIFLAIMIGIVPTSGFVT